MNPKYFIRFSCETLPRKTADAIQTLLGNGLPRVMDAECVNMQRVRGWESYLFECPTVVDNSGAERMAEDIKKILLANEIATTGAICWYQKMGGLYDE